MVTSIAGLNAERRGAGPPMLLIHGIGHRWQMWTPVLDSLAHDFDVVAVDLPGFATAPAGRPNGRRASIPASAGWSRRSTSWAGTGRTSSATRSGAGWPSNSAAPGGRRR